MKKFDIVIGIPSLKEADNIAFVAKQASRGIKKYFPGKNSVIVNVDNNSPDGTGEAFLSAKTKIPKVYIPTPKGVLGKGNNLKNLFRFANETKAKAIMVVDADIRSITPEWIKNLITPIFKGYDYVSPIYSRHKYDGTITNNLCYPIVYGIFGIDMRQPIGGDFAFSEKLNNFWIKRRWHESTKQYGIDIFMTSHAIFGDFKIAETGLGAKIHKPSAPKLGAMFSQVIRTLFINIINRRKKWESRKFIRKLDTFGLKKMDPPQELHVNLHKIEEVAKERFAEYRFLIESSITKGVFKKIDNMVNENRFEFDHKLWAKALFDLIGSYARTMDKGEIVECAKALYFLRSASFIHETWHLNNDLANEKIEEQARYFFEKRDYLIRKLRFLKNRKRKKVLV